MNDPIRIGVLGLTHDHVWSNLEQLRCQPGALVAGAAEPDSELRARFAEAFPEAELHEDAESFLEAAPLDAVYLFADNRTSAGHGVLAAERGLHCLVEKPMAADAEGADAFLDAVEKAGVIAMVNWPFAWWPQLQEAIRLAESGAIGRLWQVTYRAAHQGPAELGCSKQFVEWLYDEHRNGAGATMDYCCYGAVLARTLLGETDRVTGFMSSLVKEAIPVEDNGLMVMEYPRAIATAQGSWTQIGALTSYQTVLYGEQGTLLVGPGHDGSLQIATADDESGHPLEVPAPAPELCDSAAHFLWLLRGGGAVHPLCDPRHARDAQRMLQIGIDSDQKRRLF